jgi:hypothetical protein
MAKGTSTICDSYHEAQTDMNNFRRRVHKARAWVREKKVKE